MGGILVPYFDRYNHSVNIISDFHQHIHQGHAFHSDIEMSIVAEGFHYVLIEPDPAMHMVPRISFGGSCYVRFFKNPVDPVGGDPAEIYNYNDYSTKVTNVVVTDGVSVSSNGTPYGRDYAGGGFGNKAGGSAEGDFHEKILRTDRQYLLEIESRDKTTTHDGSITILWYHPAM